MIERRAGGSRCVFFLGMIDGEMDIWEGMATKSGMVSIDVHECSFKGAEDSRRERERSLNEDYDYDSDWFIEE